MKHLCNFPSRKKTCLITPDQQPGPAGIYLPKVNDRNTRTRSEKMLKVNKKEHQNDTIVIGVVLMSLLLTLNIFHVLFYCFCY